MALERRPLSLLDKKEGDYQAKLSAFGALKGALSSFQSALSGLSSPAKFSSLKASIADGTVATVSASSSAVAGSYSLDVTTLARAHSLKSDPFASTSATVGSGSITVTFGSWDGATFTANGDRPAQSVTINPSSNTLAGVRDAINAANIGVSASIVNDGVGQRLVVTSQYTGEDNSLKITVDDDDGTDTDTSGLSQIAYNPAAAAGSGKNLSQTVAATNAALTVNGVAIDQATNTLSDVIDGVTLTLLKETAGTPTTVTVARDSSAISNSVGAFVRGYNDLRKTLSELSAYNPTTRQAAVLQGEAALRSVESQLRDALNTSLRFAGGGLSTLSEIGISFQKDGSLAFDSSKFQKVFDDPSKDIATLFAAVAKPTDSQIKFVSAASTAEAGAYALGVTQLATQGAAVGAVTLGGSTVITAGVNDTLTVSIDSVTATVTLSAGSYTAAQLASELQAKVNGASGLVTAGIGVAVTQSAGVLTIASNRYGASSNASVTGGTAQADLFGTTTDTVGTDVAGSIGGVVGTGTGKNLAAAGLTVEVSGTTTGDRGTLNFAQGFAVQLDKLVTRLLAGDGTIAGRTDSLDDSIKEIGLRREELARRLEIIEKRFRAQFGALDAMIASMTQTSNFLTQQLANLPGSRSE